MSVPVSRSAIAWFGLALISLGPRSAAIAGPAESAYRKGDLERARSLYEERLREEPGDLRARYNLGNVLYRSAQLKAAEEAYRSTLASPDAALRARGAHNLGNARLQAGEIDGAIGAFEEALRAEPGNADSKYNLELALRMREMKPPEQKESQEQRQEGTRDKEQQRQQENQKQDDGEGQDQEKGQQSGQDPNQPPPDRGEEKQAEADQDKEQGQSPAAPEDYSKEEAERVLEGLAQEERDLLADRWRTLGRNVRVEKDW